MWGMRRHVLVTVKPSDEDLFVVERREFWRRQWLWGVVGPGGRKAATAPGQWLHI